MQVIRLYFKNDVSVTSVGRSETSYTSVTTHPFSLYKFLQYTTHTDKKAVGAVCSKGYHV
jgi:hypothetical protein